MHHNGVNDEVLWTGPRDGLKSILERHLGRKDIELVPPLVKITDAARIDFQDSNCHDTILRPALDLRHRPEEPVTD